MRVSVLLFVPRAVLAGVTGCRGDVLVRDNGEGAEKIWGKDGSTGLV
jgi:hypothetical protein